MMGNYKKLAKQFVRLDDSLKTEEEVIAFLKMRVKRLPEDKLI